MITTVLRLHETSKFQVLGLPSERQCPQDVKSRGIKSGKKVSSKTQKLEQTTISVKPCKILSVFLDIDEPYTRNMIQRAFSVVPHRKSGFRIGLGPGQGMDAVPLPATFDFQWAEYERIDWDAVLAGRHAASSYCIRKGLSRKAQLSFYTHRHVCKHPSSILKDVIPQTIILDTWAVFEGDDATPREGLADIVMGASNTSSNNRREVLDQCLAEARRAMDKAEEDFAASQDTRAEPVWILKPSTINKGSGIQIVHLYEQLVDICWSQSEVREWYVAKNCNIRIQKVRSSHANGLYVKRVLQRYVSPPLLLKRRKFHIRAYALAVGAIQVYLSLNCLALCSGTRYRKNDTGNLFSHITNTAYQDLDPNFREEDCIYVWNEESISPMLVQDKTCRDRDHAREMVQHVIKQMELITGELFSAYQNEFGVFSPIEGCFEHYGLDFLVDDQWQVYLLEVNPGPDFKQTGDRLGPVIENLMGDTIDVALLPLILDQTTSPLQTNGDLKLVYEYQVRGSSQKSRDKISMTLT